MHCTCTPSPFSTKNKPSSSRWIIVSKIYCLIAFYQGIVELWCHAKNFPNAPRISTLIASTLILDNNVCKYMQQTTEADNIFRCIFYVVFLRVITNLTDAYIFVGVTDRDSPAYYSNYTNGTQILNPILSSSANVATNLQLLPKDCK